MAIEVHEVAGVFRDPAQARLAVEAARKQGIGTVDPDSMLQDAAGVHVNLRTSGSPDQARRLLLEYGAYSATIAR
jgi:hypothetical protein